ncbi:MAG TPA: glycosyl transferase family 4 [archaeon]|nr:glycosyl transferase family 4 [archaeon]
MVSVIIIVSLLLSFLATLALVPLVARKMRAAGFVGKDIHKRGNPVLPEMGGLAVVAGVLAGLLAYTAGITFILHQEQGFLIQLLAAIATLLTIAIIGMLDDILGWKKGIPQFQKVLLTLPAAVPLMAVNAGVSDMALPFFGNVSFGLLYPLLFIPAAVVGASNAMNMLAGYNGLEAGMASLLFAGLGVITLSTSPPWVSLLSFSALFACLAFLRSNWFPAKIFPGDTFTYFSGALFASIAILGNIEKYALLLFLPYFAQFALKARGRMRKESFATPLPDGSLAPRYPKLYGLEHLSLRLLRRARGKATEQSIVSLILFGQLALTIAVIALFQARLI